MGIRNPPAPLLSERPAVPPAPPHRYNTDNPIPSENLSCCGGCHNDIGPEEIRVKDEEIRVKDEEIQLLLLRGVIASMPAEQQQIIEEAKGKIKEVLAGFPVGEGMIAVSLLVAELTQD